MTPSFKISRLKSIKTTKEIQKEKKCCHFWIFKIYVLSIYNYILNNFK
jgi:hypothetical protein